VIDVERIRRAAKKLQELGRVGMVLTVRQVLSLVARGDVGSLQTTIRIEELERENEWLRGRLEEREERPDRGARERRSKPVRSEGWVELAEAAQASGYSVQCLARFAKDGLIQGEKRPVRRNGMTHHRWFVDRAQAVEVAERRGRR